MDTIKKARLELRLTLIALIIALIAIGSVIWNTTAEDKECYKQDIAAKAAISSQGKDNKAASPALPSNECPRKEIKRNDAAAGKIMLLYELIKTWLLQRNYAAAGKIMLHLLSGWAVVYFGAIVLLTRIILRRINRDASPFIYPGIVLFVSLGWAILIDLSVHFKPHLRYLALDHFFTILGSFLLLVMLVRLYPWIYKKLLSPLVLKPRHPFIIIALVILFLSPYIFNLKGHESKTSEIIKMSFIVTLSLFFSVRGEYITERVKGWRDMFNSIIIRRGIVDIAIAIVILFLFLIAVKDLGPLLLLGILLSAAVYLSMGIARFTVFCGISALAGFAIVKSSVIAAQRVAEWLEPFSSGSGHLARIISFQASAGFWGYGVGKVMWIGFDGKRGVPMQIQSDYTYTALTGVIGYAGAIFVTILFLSWIIWLIYDTLKYGTARYKTRQQRFMMYIGFFGLLAILIQTILTVGGNLRVVPLTGITWPLISFGAASMTAVMVVFALIYAKELIVPGQGGKDE